MLLADIREGRYQILLELRLPVILLHRLVFDVSKRPRHLHNPHHTSVDDLSTPHSPLPRPPSSIHHPFHFLWIARVVTHVQLDAGSVATEDRARVSAVHAVDHLLILRATLTRR